MKFRQSAIFGGVLISGLAYTGLGYLVPRHEFQSLLLLFALAFGGYWLLVRSVGTTRQAIMLAMGLRLIFLFALPQLSDDYFRFMWDGHLILGGESPFLHLPAYYLQPGAPVFPGIDAGLFQQLNSPQYYSVYPPVCQVIFALAAWVGGSSGLVNCLVMRLFILAAEGGTLLLMARILKQFDLPQKGLWLYAFNPLVIVELSGNLHFEGLMFFFLLSSIYFLLMQRLYWSALALGMAVGVKMLPLLFLPLLYRHLGWKKLFFYGMVTAASVLLLFLPFLSLEWIGNLFTSLNLYFQKFEFNAGIYYALRWLGFRAVGYNMIAQIGPALSLGALAGILWLAFSGRTKNLPLPFLYLFALTFYFAGATIVHPWYLGTLVGLGCLTYFRFPIFWSALALLSYSAYQTPDYQENLWLVGLEYIGVAILLWWELKSKLPLRKVLLGKHSDFTYK